MLIPNVWHDIPGYNGKYQINAEGQIRSMFGKTPKMKRCKPNPGKYNCVTVQMTRPDGVARHEKVLQLMVRTFYPDYDRRLKPYHIDGNNMNNRLENIGFATQSDIGKRFGGARRRAVCKVDQEGNVLETYRSVADTVRKNPFSGNNVLRRLKNRTKNPFAETGYTFQYMDDVLRKNPDAEW